MNTYPDQGTQPGPPLGFEIDNIYVSLNAVAKILKSVSGVSEVKRRKLFGSWNGVHIWFNYLGHEYVVVEPFGDSSRYWIGPAEFKESIDIKEIDMAFREYEPSLPIKLLGDIVSLDFTSLFKNFRKH